MRFALPHHLAAIGLAITTALSAGSAAAATIENWEYQLSNAFTGATFTAGSGSQSIGSTAVSWGGTDSTDRSSIGIASGSLSGTLTTNGAAVPANTYTHNNNPISGSYATLATATITATLGLRPVGSTDPFTVSAQSYTVRFAETPNATPCAAASPADTPCNDIWVLEGALNKSFTLGADTYYFSFYAFPDLAALPVAACEAANATTDPCQGFTTIEGRANEVNFMMRITSTPITIPGEVPEPASIALLGVGLLGLVGARARRQTNRA